MIRERGDTTGIDDSAGSEMFMRNIMNSQRIVSGAFEEALADILAQYEVYAHTTEGRKVSATALTGRIGREIKRGLAGLHPNGFEFAMWLWDVSPIHHIDIPPDSSLRMRELVFFYLRTLAAIIAEDYVMLQSEKSKQIIALLDSSAMYLDAKNLVLHSGLLRLYRDQLQQRYKELFVVAEGRAVRRKLLPLIIAENTIEQFPAQTARYLALVEKTFAASSDKIIGYAIFKALTAILWSGDRAEFADFIAARSLEQDPFIRKMFADIIASGDTAFFTHEFIEKTAPVFSQWEEDCAPQKRFPFLRALKKLDAAAFDRE